jgi:hypothetical protein
MKWPRLETATAPRIFAIIDPREAGRGLLALVEQTASTEVTSGQSMTPPNDQPFQVHSYIGSNIAQMGEMNESPPQSAELVASVYLGGNDNRTYLLSAKLARTDRETSGWTLWQKGSDYDTGQPLYCRVGFGYPLQSCQAAFAAAQILAKTWEDESMEGLLVSQVTVDAAGLLSAEEVRRIFSKAFG